MLVVFTIGLTVQPNELAEARIPSFLFMGFGYNPDLMRCGERLDMFDFFSWMRILQEDSVKEFTVWDASGYFIVNRTPQKKIKKLGKLTGKNILEILVNEQDRPKRAEIKENCDLRSRYLQRLMQISRIQGNYFDSRVIFREDPRYESSLDLALEFVERLKVDNPKLINQILPQNRNPASELYLPLEIAEALYLKETRGIQGKFGPETEKYFDACILGLQDERQIPFVAVRSPLGPRKPGYLSDRDVFWTQTPDYYILELLEDDQYKEFVQRYLNTFQKPEEELIGCIKRMRDQLKGELK